MDPQRTLGVVMLSSDLLWLKTKVSSKVQCSMVHGPERAISRGPKVLARFWTWTDLPEFVFLISSTSSDEEAYSRSSLASRISANRLGSVRDSVSATANSCVDNYHLVSGMS